MNNAWVPVCGLLCIWPGMLFAFGWWLRGLVIQGYRLRSPFGRDDVAGFGRSPVPPRPVNVSPAGKPPAPKPIQKVE